jgi:hypothetical protein
MDAWDHAWSFACWSQGGLSILPDRTLVANVGFGPDATHFSAAPDDPRARLVAEPMAFPLRHPPCVIEDRAADDFIIRKYVLPWSPPPLPRRLYWALRRRLSAAIPAPVRRAGKRAFTHALRPARPV